MKMNRHFSFALAVGLAAATHTAIAVPFTPGNLALYRVGDGSAALPALGSQVFIDEYTTAGTLVQTLTVPSTDPDGAGPQRRLVGHGSADIEGLLNLSTDGQYLFFTGYDQALGGPTATSLAADVPRVVARVSADGTIDTSTILTDLDDGLGTQSGSPRSAMSTNGTDIWVTGAEGGVRYTTFGSTAASTQLSSDITNLRHVDIFGGQLHISTMSGSAVRIGTVGSGTPTTSGQTIATLPGVPTTGTGGANPDPTQFWMADLSETEPGPDVLYIADSRSQTNLGGLYKFSLVSGTWNANGSIAGVQTPNPAVSILRGITGRVNGSNVDIFMTRNNGQQLMTVSDASGHNGTLSGAATVLTTLAAPSPGNWKFAGIDWAPVAGNEPIPGDFNNDQKVDDDDFDEFVAEFGDTLDGEDFLDFQQFYGTGVPAAAAAGAVPEPGTVALAGIALVGLLGRMRRGDWAAL